MEQQLEKRTGLILPELNDHCLLEITKYLDLFDVVNLAYTCRRLKKFADLFLFKKYTTLKIDKNLIKRGFAWIDKVFACVGPHLVTLDCDLEGMRADHFWPAINAHCTNLNDISINGWRERKQIDFRHFDCFDSVSSLSMLECRLHQKSNFYWTFCNLSFLSLDNSANGNDVKILLSNNNNLYSLAFRTEKIGKAYEIEMRWLRMVPGLQELRIEVCRQDEYGELANAVSLTTLELWCEETNINELLSLLAKKNKLETMELVSVKFDRYTGDIMKQFTTLERLFVNAPELDMYGEDRFILTPLFTWPPNLKQLALVGHVALLENLTAAVRQMKMLEKIDFNQCHCRQSDIPLYNDLKYLCQTLFEAMSGRKKGTVLEVVVPGIRNADDKSSPNCLFDGNGLRLFKSRENFDFLL
ncbi:hypothetical protein Bhyg_02224 [Pseudolycoriella hygida]|uniref:F-box domain-containing protein n=1 Tax=Pseudolycoriella hygida TaxID=35572 RepID=A0A9Q0NAZ6_9DIPT|nr:hypothetical protein Bhyg_02224 [Pseudolycoriella hygida]